MSMEDTIRSNASRIQKNLKRDIVIFAEKHMVVSEKRAGPLNYVFHIGLCIIHYT